MKTRISKLLAVFLCLSFIVSTVKVHSSGYISKQEFDKIIDFMSAEFTLHYYLHYSKQAEIQKEQIRDELLKNFVQSPLSKNVIENFINTDSIALRMLSLVQEQKNINSNNNDNFINQVINLKQSNKFEDPVRVKIWDAALNKVFKHYNINQSISNSPQLGVNDNSEHQNAKQYANLSEKNNFWPYAIIALLILFSFFGSVLVGAKYTNGEIRKLKSETLAKLNDMRQYRFEDRAFKNLEGTLNDKIRQLEQSLNNLKHDYYNNKPSQIRSSDSSIYQKQHPSPREPINPPLENVNFYMRVPSMDGFFNNSQKRDYPVHGNTLYKFEVIGQNSATFFLECDQIAMKDAIEAAYKYVDPVCESDNEIFSSSSKIKTIEPGLAELEGDKWIVKHKAKIRYE